MLAIINYYWIIMQEQCVKRFAKTFFVFSQKEYFEQMQQSLICPL